MIKSNWTLDDLQWHLHDKDDMNDWDGLIGTFIKLVELDNNLKQDVYINKWYRAVKKILKQSVLESGRR